MKKFQINFAVRVKNKLFWLAFVPAVLFFVQSVFSLFGIDIDLKETQKQMVTIVEAAFSILAILGVVNDPTTQGISDSDNAMKYDEPKER